MARAHIAHGMFNAYKPNLPMDHPRKSAEQWAMFSRRTGDGVDFYDIRDTFAPGATIIGVNQDSLIAYANVKAETADPIRGLQVYELREYPPEESKWYLNKRFDPVAGNVLDPPPVVNPQMGGPTTPAGVLLSTLNKIGIIPDEKMQEAIDELTKIAPPPPQWSQPPADFTPPPPPGEQPPLPEPQVLREE
jgi:hypothetical protein